MMGQAYTAIANLDPRSNWEISVKEAVEVPNLQEDPTMRGVHSGKRACLAFCTGVIVATVGCASGPNTVSRSTRNTSIDISYGRVAEISQVELRSNAAAGAVIGGLVGLFATRGRSASSQVLGTAGGAALGGLGTRALEGSNQANAYTVRRLDGSTVKVVTEPTGIHVGDCVAIEEGKATNLRRVSEVMCERRTANPVDAELDRIQMSEATECDEAKQAILEANTETAMEGAIRKARVLCEH